MNDGILRRVSKTLFPLTCSFPRRHNTMSCLLISRSSLLSAITAPSELARHVYYLEYSEIEGLSAWITVWYGVGAWSRITHSLKFLNNETYGFSWCSISVSSCIKSKYNSRTASSMVYLRIVVTIEDVHRYILRPELCSRHQCSYSMVYLPLQRNGFTQGWRGGVLFQQACSDHSYRPGTVIFPKILPRTMVTHCWVRQPLLQKRRWIRKQWQWAFLPLAAAGEL